MTHCCHTIPLRRQRAAARRGARHGYTLVEVIVSLGIVSMLALAFTGSTMFARRAAEANVAESTALTVASGYLEQIKSLEYDSLVASAKDPTKPIATMVNQGVEDPIYLNKYTDKTVVLNIDDDGNPVKTITISVMPQIDDLSSTGRDILNIRVRYKWTAEDTGAQFNRELRTSRSLVPTF